MSLSLEKGRTYFFWFFFFLRLGFMGVLHVRLDGMDIERNARNLLCVRDDLLEGC